MARALQLLKVGASLDLFSLNRGLAKAKRSSTDTFKSIGKAGVLAGVTAGVGLAAGITKAVIDFEKLEDTIVKGTGRSGDALESAVDQVREMATVVPGANEELAGLFATMDTGLATLKLTDETLGRLSTLTAQYARNTDQDLGDAGKQVTALINNWRLASEDVPGFIDVLNKVQQDYNVGAAVLQNLLQKNGDELRAFGFTSEESAVLVGKFAAEGERGTRSMSSMFDALGNFAKKEGKDADVVFEELTTSIANASTEQEALRIATEALGGTYGTEFAEAVRRGKFELGDATDILKDAQGTVADTAAATLTLGDRFELVGDSLLQTMQPALTAILRGLEDLMPVVQEGIKWFGDNLAPIFRELGENLMPALSRFWSESLNPIIEKFTNNILPPLIALWKDTLMPAFSEFAEDVLPEIEKLFREVIGPAFDWFAEEILPVLINILEFVLPIAFDALVLVIKTAVAAIQVAWNVFETAFDIGAAVVTGIINGLTATWNALKDAAVGAFELMWGGIKWYINQILGGIESFINGLASGIDSVGGLLSKIPGVEIPEVPRLQLPRLAEGGVVREPTIAMVGEAGPEAVVPLDKAGVGRTVIVNINAENVFGDDIDDFIRRTETAIAGRGL